MLWEFEAAQNFSLLTLLIAVGSHRCRISHLSNGRFQLYFLFKTSGTIYLKPLSCLITEMRDWLTWEKSQIWELDDLNYFLPNLIENLGIK